MRTLQELSKTKFPNPPYKGAFFEKIPLKYLDLQVDEDDLPSDTREAIMEYLSEPAIARLLEEQLEREAARQEDTTDEQT